MSNSWRQEYQKLTGFIASHPEIVITRERVCTPEESRAGFYSLFDATRTALVEQLCSSSIEEARSLADAYRRAAKEATESFNIAGISASAEFNGFVQNPKAILVRPLFGLLFELLEGKDDDYFEQAAKLAVESFAHDLQTIVYGKWIILSLMNILKPVELYQCAFEKPRNYRVIHLDLVVDRFDDIPLPVKTDRLSWEPPPVTTLTLPDFIMRSSATETSRYVGIKSSFVVPVHHANKPNGNREWLSRETDVPIGNNTTLVYVGNNPIDISLVAEKGRMCKPDLVIKHWADVKAEPNQLLEEARKDSETLQPELGLYAVSSVPVVQQTEPLAKIHFLQVGFDPSKLAPIVEALTNQEGAASNVQSAPVG
jgi:hypothetical protein